MAKITLDESVAPDTPAADKVDVYAKAGGKIYAKDDAGIETVLNTDAEEIASVIHAATGKDTPIDADELSLWDSVAGALKKLTIANLKVLVRASINNIFGSDGKADADLDMDSHAITNAASVSTGSIDTTGDPSDGDGVGNRDYNDARYTQQSTGSWTPALEGTTNPTISYTTQEGTYTKIGRLVFIEGNIVINTVSGGSGAVKITGLPFACKSGDSTAAGIAMSGVEWGSGTATFIRFNGGTAEANLLTTADNAAWAYVGCSDLAAGDQIRFGFCYQASS